MLVTLLVRRLAAVGAALSGLLHLVLLAHGHHLGRALVMAAMAITCLPCAGHLWRRASRRSWITIATMNAAMLGLHSAMLAGTGLGLPGPERQGVTLDAGPPPGHVHAASAELGAGADVGPASLSPGSGVGLLHDVLLPLASSLAALEILLALTALVLLRRKTDHLRNRGRRDVSASVQAGNTALHCESSP